jgi:NADP-dependent 3-hydroxy acid dehydrogenase YdfG
LIFWSTALAMGTMAGSVLSCSEHDWDFSFDLSVKSMHLTIKAFLPAMMQKRGGLSTFSQ